MLSLPAFVPAADAAAATITANEVSSVRRLLPRSSPFSEWLSLVLECLLEQDVS